MDSLHFMEPEGSSPCVQQPASSPYPEPGRSSPHRPSCFLNTFLILSFHVQRDTGWWSFYRLCGLSSNPGKNEYFLFSKPSRLSLGPSSFLFKGVWSSFLREIKELEQEADYSPPPSAEVSNAWSHPSSIASWRAQGQSLPSISLFCYFSTKNSECIYLFAHVCHMPRPSRTVMSALLSLPPS